MSFAVQLQAAKGDLTARQVAAAVSPVLSHRTVEDWLADRRTPPEWTQDWILSRVGIEHRRQTPSVWESVDWTLNDSVIARQLNVNPSAVVSQRQRRGHPPGPSLPRVRGDAVDWQSVDWTLSSEAIAELHNRSLSVVYLNRQRYAPNTLKRPRKQRPNAKLSHEEGGKEQL